MNELIFEWKIFECTLAIAVTMYCLDRRSDGGRTDKHRYSLLRQDKDQLTRATARDTRILCEGRSEGIACQFKVKWALEAVSCLNWLYSRILNEPIRLKIYTHLCSSLGSKHTVKQLVKKTRCLSGGRELGQANMSSLSNQKEDNESDIPLLP